MSVRRGKIEELTYIEYITERCYFPLLCRLRKAIDDFEVKLNVQKGLESLKKKLTIDVLVSSNSHFHSLLSYGNSPPGLLYPFLFGFAFAIVLFLYKFANSWLLEHSWARLSSALWIVAKLLCSCLCLFDAIVEFTCYG